MLFQFLLVVYSCNSMKSNNNYNSPIIHSQDLWKVYGIITIFFILFRKVIAKLTTPLQFLEFLNYELPDISKNNVMF